MRLNLSAAVTVDIKDIFGAWKDNLCKEYSLAMNWDTIGIAKTTETSFVVLKLFFDLGIYSLETHPAQHQRLKELECLVTKKDIEV